MTIEVFLDDTPGERRGVVRRNGRPAHLLIHRESDPPAFRLGARSVGRVVRLERTLAGAFVDLGVGEASGFLALGKTDRLTEGALVDVVVTAEPRDDKGPALKQVGPATGLPRLLEEGPSIESSLTELAPGAVVVRGADAIVAGIEAEEDGMAAIHAFPEVGVSLSVERTRALVAVDIDHGPMPGRDGRRDKARANHEGLRQAARLIGLKGWGGLVALDLIGAGHDGAALTAVAKMAFGDDGAVIGPVNRFGVMMLSLPWRRTPLEARLLDASGRLTDETRVIDAIRRLNLALARDRTVPYLTLTCPPDLRGRLAPLVDRLGPRARLADGAPGSCELRINQG